ncbi:lipase family protein [Actinomycetospora endophytica]|uniref:Lipase family protein n=1 Tax=Actinomycetospora endophytica TaxID=2291215 RepID=A0ABS8P1Z2_9PSEU|nr:lipase family protein [Actinomycetospora endophytica]MCD2192263.1 lipase family protein [Actinomycetospora endophytica]
MRRLLVTLFTALTVLTVGATAAAAAPAASGDAFYQPPATLPAHDGEVIRSEPFAVALPATATRILYRSTDTAGRAIAVSGTVLVPTLPAPGPRKLISYAVGTQGLADRCAPSRQFAAGTEYESAFVSQLLARGYAVVVTDYQGLGTPGPHTYVNRAAEGHAVLDAVRAARDLGSVPEDGPSAISGYSQGGGASAAAAELAPSYAPDVERTLVGAYAGAVPADLAATGVFLDGKPSAGLIGYALNGFDAAYPDLHVPDVLNAAGKRFLAETRDQCVADTALRYQGTRSETLTSDGRSLAQILGTEPFRSRVEEQRIGLRAPQVPMYVAHSVADDIVPFDQDAAMVRSWCSEGAKVQFAPVPVPTHVGGAVAAFPGALAFLDARFAGRPTPSTCR